MALNVEVNIDKVDNFGAKAIEGVRRYLEEGADYGRQFTLYKVPKDKSTLFQSIAQYEPTWDGDELKWGTQDVPYAAAQEFGTDPYTPPLEPLLRWADRNMSSPVSADTILEELEEDGWSPAIFRHPGAAVWSKIRSEGIEGKFFLTEGKARQEQWYRKHDAGEWIDRELK